MGILGNSSGGGGGLPGTFPSGLTYPSPTITGVLDADGATYATGLPFVLSSSAIPFIGISTGSVDANGVIVVGTALPTAYPHAYCYFPANILATTIAAGWHYCTFSTTTGGVAYLNTYTSGKPTVPASPTAVTDGKGAYTGVTTEITAVSVSVPAGSMGANGAIRVQTAWAQNNSGGSKTLSIKLATTSFLGVALTTQTRFGDLRLIQNAGVANVQRGSAPLTLTAFVTDAGALPVGAVDTTSAQNVSVTLLRNTATDNAILAQHTFELIHAE